MALLNIYVFLYVFSLSLPIFYHSAFFVGFAALVHLLSVRKIKFLNIDKFFIRFLYINVFVYFSVFSISIASGEYDLSFLKTFTNFFLSGICAIPLAYLIIYYNGRNSVKFLANSFFIVFLAQSLIIISVLAIPPLKPIVTFFHRNAELSAELDIFSNGLRTNALSGGLFFGLAISYSLGILVSSYHYLVVEKRKPTFKITILFLIVNIGLVISGRFGLIYIFPLLLCLPFVQNLVKIRLVLIGILSLLTLFGVGFLIYEYVPMFATIFDNVIYPYVFEMLDAYLSGHGMHSQSTGRLASMYDINVSVEQLLVGDGLYTGLDGKYYMHTDVGFLRHLLFGGAFFIVLGYFHLIILLLPLIKSKEMQMLSFAVITLITLCSFKGEVFMTMVSVLTPLFLFSYVKYLEGKI